MTKELFQHSMPHSTPYEVRYAAVNSWEIPQSIVDYWFDKYYLLHWQGVWLADQVNNGIILHDGVRYRVNWRTVPTICYKSDNVMISFRRIYGKDEGYALITVKGA